MSFLVVALGCQGRPPAAPAAVPGTSVGARAPAPATKPNPAPIRYTSASLVLENTWGKIAIRGYHMPAETIAFIPEHRVVIATMNEVQVIDVETRAVVNSWKQGEGRSAVIEHGRALLTFENKIEIPEGGGFAEDASFLVRSLPDGAVRQRAKIEFGDDPRFSRSIERMVVSPNEQMVAIVHSGKTSLVDVSRGLPKRAGAGFDGVAAVFSADGTHLAVEGATFFQGFSVVDVATQKRVACKGERTQYQVPVRFVSGGSQLFAQGHGHASLYDVATGNEVSHFAFETPVFLGAFSADGRVAATVWGNDEHTPGATPQIRLWDARTWKPLWTVDVDYVKSLAFDPEGAHLYVGGREVDVFDVATGENARAGSGHVHAVEQVDVSRDGARALSLDREGHAILWSTRDAHIERRPTEHAAKIASALLSPDGETIVTASSRGLVKRWQRLAAEPLWVDDHSKDVDGLRSDENGRIAICDHKSVRILSPADRKLVREVDGKCYDGSFYLSGNALTHLVDETLVRTELATGSKRTLANDIKGNCISGSGAWLAVGSCIGASPSFPEAIDVVHSFRKRLGDKEQHVDGFAITPDGTVAIVEKGELSLWNGATGSRIDKLVIALDEITAARFSPDGRHLFVGMHSGVIHDFRVKR